MMIINKTSGLSSIVVRFVGKRLIRSICLSLQIFALASIITAQSITINRKIKTKILSFLISLLLIGGINSKTYHIEGNAFTDSNPVSYALVTIIDGYSREFSTISDSLGNYEIDILTKVQNQAPLLSQNIESAQNYPNPFNPSTKISFQLEKEFFIKIKIYNILGKGVKTLLKDNFSPGYHEIIWDGSNYSGENLLSGINFYTLKTGGYLEAKKMIILL